MSLFGSIKESARILGNNFVDWSKTLYGEAGKSLPRDEFIRRRDARENPSGPWLDQTLTTAMGKAEGLGAQIGRNQNQSATPQSQSGRTI